MTLPTVWILIFCENICLTLCHLKHIQMYKKWQNRSGFKLTRHGSCIPGQKTWKCSKVNLNTNWNSYTINPHKLTFHGKIKFVVNEILRSVHYLDIIYPLCAITRNYSSLGVYKREHFKNTPKIMQYVCPSLQGKENYFFILLTLNNSIIGSVKHTFHNLLNDDQ